MRLMSWPTWNFGDEDKIIFGVPVIGVRVFFSFFLKKEKRKKYFRIFQTTKVVESICRITIRNFYGNRKREEMAVSSYIVNM